MNEVLKKLNQGAASDRLQSLREVLAVSTPPEVLPQYANNHIHTFYSFSPYSPTAAVYYASRAGLPTAGIMDHDSIAGAEEFTEAGRLIGIGTTVGIECRVSVKGTPLEGRKVNNPDQHSVVYMALHGVPHQHIATIQQHFAPYRELRNTRNRKMVENINKLIAPVGLSLDFDRDVLPISKYHEGGSVTERHLMYALALRMVERFGRGPAVVELVQTRLGISLGEGQISQLSDPNNPYYEYDLLGIFKGSLVEQVFVDATDECMHISELKQLSVQTGALLCYPYLGDVGDSVTGDKKTQKFEDDYLDLLFEVLKDWQIDAVTYMPSRNTPGQLARLQQKCKDYGFFEISGEDINQPRQKFICSQLAQPQFAHLIDAAWSLIDYENRATLAPTSKPVRND